MTGDEPAIHDAATVIVVRDVETAPRILMGQRGQGAVFMANKVVFPGGRVDPSDYDVRLANPVQPPCAQRLVARGTDATPDALAAAAIRELWEETAQMLGSKSGLDLKSPKAFAERGLAPDASALRFFFRAVTPPGRSRRFDARFFLVDARALVSDPDDFTGAEPELSHLRWVPLDEVRELDLAFITRVVLGELARHLPRMDAPDAVPLVRNDDIAREVVWL